VGRIAWIAAISMPWSPLDQALFLGVGGLLRRRRTRALFFPGVEATDHLVGQIEMGLANTTPALLSRTMVKFSAAAILPMIRCKRSTIGWVASSSFAQDPADVADRSAGPCRRRSCSSASFWRTVSAGSSVRFLFKSSMAFFTSSCLLVELLLLLVEVLLEGGARLAAVLGFIQGAAQIHVAEFYFLGAAAAAQTGTEEWFRAVQYESSSHLHLGKGRPSIPQKNRQISPAYVGGTNTGSMEPECESCSTSCAPWASWRLGLRAAATYARANPVGIEERHGGVGQGNVD